MTDPWTFSDYFIQWLWVGIIVASAIFFCVRRFFRSSKRRGGDDACGGCPLKDNCHHDSSRCDHPSSGSGRGGSGSCGCC
ncbi:MAG: FeoB-associated Cys-rich membrane protein [Muribaculum sp.]|nr:FeoB-associated Cys-rich membrane protein [Muribaculum sp.]MDE6457290.1 FeoB-associated Cys-rich membrane protein [Muribaculum sp.]